MSGKTNSTKQIENKNAVELTSVQSNTASASDLTETSTNTPSNKPETIFKEQIDDTKRSKNLPTDKDILNINIDMTAGATSTQNKEQDIFAASRRNAEQSLKNLAQRTTNNLQTNMNTDHSQSRSSNKLSPSVQRSKAVRTLIEKNKESENPPKINLLADIKRADNSNINSHSSDKAKHIRKMESRNMDIVSHESQMSTSTVNQPQVDFAHHESTWTEIQSANGPVRADHPTWMEHGHETSHVSMSHAPNQHISQHSHAHDGITQQGICKSQFHLFYILLLVIKYIVKLHLYYDYPSLLKVLYLQ